MSMLLLVDFDVTPGNVSAAIVLNQIQLPAIHFHVKANWRKYKLSHCALKSFSRSAILEDLYGTLAIDF